MAIAQPAVYFNMILVHYGSSSGKLDLATPNLTIVAGNYTDRAGWSLACADIDQDNFTDLIAGASLYPNSSVAFGRILGYRGSPSGLNTTIAWVSTPSKSNANFGYSIDTGDFNNDGYPDILVGAPEETVTAHGSVYVCYGSSSGFGPPVLITNTTDALELGVIVVTAKKINNDSYEDAVIAAPGNGSFWILLGSADGLQPAATVIMPPPSLPTSFANTRSLATGDINQDGFTDVIYSGGNWNYSGAAFIYINQGGVIPSSPTCIRAGTSQDLDSFGSAAEIVEQKPFSYVLISEYGYDNDYYNAGRVLLYSSETVCSGEVLWSLEGDQNGTLLGQKMKAVGDIDNDGFADWTLSSPSYLLGSAVGQVTLITQYYPSVSPSPSIAPTPTPTNSPSVTPSTSSTSSGSPSSHSSTHHRSSNENFYIIFPVLGGIAVLSALVLVVVKKSFTRKNKHQNIDPEENLEYELNTPPQLNPETDNDKEDDKTAENIMHFMTTLNPEEALLQFRSKYLQTRMTDVELKDVLQNGRITSKTLDLLDKNLHTKLSEFLEQTGLGFADENSDLIVPCYITESSDLKKTTKKFEESKLKLQFQVSQNRKIFSNRIMCQMYYRLKVNGISFCQLFPSGCIFPYDEIRFMIHTSNQVTLQANPTEISNNTIASVKKVLFIIFECAQQPVSVSTTCFQCRTNLVTVQIDPSQLTIFPAGLFFCSACRSLPEVKTICEQEDSKKKKQYQSIKSFPQSQQWKHFCELLDHNWSDLCLYLDVSPSQVSRLKETYSSNPHFSPSDDMLKQWLQQEDATLAKLIDILCKIDNVDAVSCALNWPGISNAN